MDRITRCTSEVPFYSQHVTLPFREMSCLVTARLAGARAWHHGWLSPPLKKPRGRLGVCHGGESVFWKHSINMHPPPPPQKWAVDTKWDLIQIVSNTDSSRAAVDLWTWTRALPSVCVCVCEAAAEESAAVSTDRAPCGTCPAPCCTRIQPFPRQQWVFFSVGYRLGLR